jgi:hypothetical protein
MTPPIDIEGAKLEDLMWKPTGELRWFRPWNGNDNDFELQVLWERVTGERQWRPVPKALE